MWNIEVPKEIAFDKECSRNSNFFFSNFDGTIFRGAHEIRGKKFEFRRTLQYTIFTQESGYSENWQFRTLL